ncbi:E3 ubiquitin-protein ligase TRIM11-like [Nerophis ophidion]|uniref:E3 ubiquitin-protein ligase TRIM11-like n=1 Tax=Nerophis ophidion TaxID=159077 RepID=UPI002AE055BC|nr:E3 ubiquitin-protein ligase TRIM11-like [Nerophis ophidion]XP_061774922.1 E3 ubiquitin-protein ligase TRIM11-like [Nerophis ophidion]
MAAAAWSEEETFVCSVCLESLNDPATLPCGHSYCLACIQRHWDKGDSKGQYRCPQCRQRFDPRPALAKSTVLVEAMEKLRTITLTHEAEYTRKALAQAVQVNELFDSQMCFVSHLKGLIHEVVQESVRLCLEHEALSRLANMQDHTCFPKNFFTMEQAGGACAIPEVSVLSRVNEHSATAPSVTPDDDHGQATVQNTVYEMLNPVPPPRPQGHDVSTKPPCQLPVSLLPPQPFCQLQEFSVTTVGLVSPEPKTREELLKFRFKPTMDPDTVFRHILLSDGGHKATLQVENLNLADHPERFQYWKQLLCKEPLAGSPYYWEVEWTGQKITIGVAYREMDRKCTDEKSRLGHNPYSWTLYCSETGFIFWHNGHGKVLCSLKSRRIGTYLDQHAGILAFYCITNNQADLIHRHMNLFTGPLYPGFRFCEIGATITICHLE